MFSPVLRAYSGTPLTLEVQREAEPPHGVQVRLERAAAPRVSAALTLRAEPANDLLRDLEITADVPAEALRGFLPEAAQVSGTGSLRMLRARGSASFTADADLTAVRLADGDYLEKKAGEVLRVRLDGAAGKSWSAHTLTIAAEHGAIPLELGEHGVSTRRLDVDLEGFSFLLIDGARATGRLTGSFDSATKSVELQLEGVGLWLSPGLGVDAADGTIAIKGHDWGITGLRVRGARSDATFDAAVQQGELRGKLTGARVDADFVRALLEQIHALDFADREPDTSPRISGTLAVALDRVAYRRAEAERFSAAIQFEKDDIHARNVAFAVGEGRVSGRVDVAMRKPQPPLLDLELEFSNLSRSFVDALLNDESRGTPGSWEGRLRFTAPLHADLKAMMPDASGSLVATARDGTLIGRIGLATKIVTVLRSTEALRMRLPAFRDEGLVFDNVRGELVMEQGRLEIRKFELDSTSYALSATGEVNFREDTSRIPIEVDAIRGITSLVERVPLAGDALKIVDVRLVATGSPWDMRVRVASIQDQLIGVGMAGPKAVMNGMRDVMNLMRAAGVTLSPAPNAEPLPESPRPAPEPVPAPSPSP
jgi:hypothetical protein